VETKELKAASLKRLEIKQQLLEHLKEELLTQAFVEETESLVFELKDYEMKGNRLENPKSYLGADRYLRETFLRPT